MGLVAVAWLATIAFTIVSLNHEMNEMFDEELQALVETTILSLDATQGGVIARNIGVQTNDGERILRIIDPNAAPPPAPWPTLTGEGFLDQPGWRILRRSAERAVIEAAHATAWRREEVFEAASTLLLLILPLMALLLWGLRHTTRAATAPVTRLAQAVALRKPDDLSPVPADGLPDELRPLAEAFSAYVLRIEALRRSERDFVANAAHELRTPLAAIRGRLEISANPDTKPAITMIDALTRRVERLLQLARLEGEVGIGGGPSDLVRILGLLIAEIRPRSPHPIHFDDGDHERMMVAADPDALAILLRNLIENATEHGTGTVRITLAPDGCLTIANPATVALIDETRFQRRPDSAGMGLGLSIVENLAKAMHATVTRRIDTNGVAVDLHFSPAH